MISLTSPITLPITAKQLEAHASVLERLSEPLQSAGADPELLIHDICYKPSTGIPEIRNESAPGYVYQELFNSMQPCMWASPLNCFWDGSRFLGPRPAIGIPPVLQPFAHNATNMTWSSVDLADFIKNIQPYAGPSPAVSYVQAVLGTIPYTKMLCLDVNNPNCPDSSKKPSTETIESLLRVGCPSMQAANFLVSGLTHPPAINYIAQINDKKIIRSIGFLSSPEILAAKLSKEQPKGDWNVETASNAINRWIKHAKKFVDSLPDDFELVVTPVPDVAKLLNEEIFPV